MTTIMSERPRCCRNLLPAFNEAATTDLEPEAPELSENRENLFVEELLSGDRERFKATWGYDTLEDKPVVGSNWEYELIYPSPLLPRQEEVGVEEVDDVATVEEDVVEEEQEEQEEREEVEDGTGDAK